MKCPKSRRSQRSLLGTVFVTLSVVALGAPVLVPVAAGAQQTGARDARGYSPCENGESDIDLLVMMDASGSLNSPGGGLDPDGSLRNRALGLFRADLTSVLRDLPQDSSTQVRVALWRFESSVRRIAPFGVPSADHPSDAQIEESLGDIDGGRLAYRRNHTDYIRALRAAEGAFRDESPPGACRLLLFFTDGLYDPLGRMTLEQADDLRDVICGQIKPSYLNAGIDVYSILLGDRFRQTRTDAAEAEIDEVEAEMLAASLQVMRALTGHGDSPLVRGLPAALGFDCERWSDETPGDRTGAIITIGDLDRLSVQLLEVAEVAARGLVEWTNCGVTPDGDTRSGPLPAGRYIESIVAYPRDSLIEAYRIVTADGRVVTGEGSWRAPLRLDGDDLEDLAAGWTIEFVTDGAGGGIDVACYARLASAETAVTSGEVADADGNEPPEVVRSPDGPDSAPQGGGTRSSLRHRPACATTCRISGPTNVCVTCTAGRTGRSSLSCIRSIARASTALTNRCAFSTSPSMRVRYSAPANFPRKYASTSTERCRSGTTASARLCWYAPRTATMAPATAPRMLRTPDASGCLSLLCR